MKCIDGPYICALVGFSGGSPCCAAFLKVGETKFIKDGKINEPCPLETKPKTDGMLKSILTEGLLGEVL